VASFLTGDPDKKTHDPSWNISKCETYFDDRVPFWCWKIVHSLYDSGARFCLGGEQPKKYGVEFGTDLVSESNTTPYVSAEIFFDHIPIVFVHNPVELSMLDEFAGEIAMFFIDNCLRHIAKDVIGLLVKARMRIMTFAPHTAQGF
jgi:hypothetical protein